MGIENGDHFPFAYKPEEDTIGSGYESLVKKLGPDWVFKNVNPVDLGGNPKSSQNIEAARSEETVVEATKVQKRLEEIFGERHFFRSYYIYGENPDGKKEYMLVQRHIPGKTLEELTSGDKKEFDSLEDLVTKNREQFKEIIWATKKALMEFGNPIDFHIKNFMRDDRTGDIILMDPGFPTEDYRSFSDPKISVDQPEEKVQGFFKRIDRIREIEGYLKLSEEEIQELNERYGVDAESVNNKIDQMHRNAKEREIAKTEKRKQEVSGFLDSVFGDNDSATGEEIVQAALKVIGEIEIPERTQKIMDKLLAQREKKGDRQFWLEQIM